MDNSTAKTRIDEGEVLAFVRARVSPDIERVEPVIGGETSQAFAFSSAANEYIIRVNTDDFAFRKDEFAARHFASAALPIPSVLYLGPMSRGHVACITRRAPGMLLNLLPAAVRDAIMPQVMAMLDAIHTTNVPEGGYGVFDATGHAPHDNWRDALLGGMVEEEPHWRARFENTCMEPAVYRKLHARAASLAANLPATRRLVHGDVGMDNVLAGAAGITAVIDWGGAMYGDPLYDVAWLHVWWREVPFARLYREHAARSGVDPADYDARLQCYGSCIGLQSLEFFAQSSQPGKYEWLKTRLAGIGIL